VNFIRKSFTGDASATSRLADPAFAVGFDWSIVASSVGRNVNVPEPDAAGVVTETDPDLADSFPAASTADTV
jgi:hypothetical protein